MMNEAAGSVDERLGPDYGKYARSAADSLAGFADTLNGKQGRRNCSKTHAS